ncbi:MAG: DUF4230 domain-containing protein [Bacteroidetes bacterium]|nr:DUF4230 domain-containing protein [Bacteroidota bacterium]
MKTIGNNLRFLISAVMLIVAAFFIGKWMGTQKGTTRLIENYAFVKNIAELATLEVSGTTTYKSTNVDQQASWWSSVSAFFTEKSATIMVPYQAKYGVDVSKDSITISHQDSVLIITFPPAKLLSYELRLDRMETSNRKGLLVFSDDEFYTAFQQQLYAKSRTQLEQNLRYLQASRDRICEVMNQYVAPTGLKVQCKFK